MTIPAINRQLNSINNQISELDARVSSLEDQLGATIAKVNELIQRLNLMGDQHIPNQYAPAVPAEEGSENNVPLTVPLSREPHISRLPSFARIQNGDFPILGVALATIGIVGLMRLICRI